MINIGDVLILEHRNTNKFEKYRCKVVGKEKHQLYIDYPINVETNKTAYLFNGTNLTGTFVTNDSSVYTFATEIIKRVNVSIPMLVLVYPGEHALKKIQRRQFVRIETAVDVAVYPSQEEFPPFVAYTGDISAGGAAIILENHGILKPQMEILNWFVLPMENGDTHYVKLKSKVVRTSTLNNGKIAVSIQFNDVLPEDRRLLLRFCFDRQLAMKKKGLEA